MERIITMKLRKQSKNKTINRQIHDDVGTDPEELDQFLENIGKKIGETKEHIIHGLHKIPETGKPEKKTEPRRSLKKRQ
jgi:hypothetical protein